MNIITNEKAIEALKIAINYFAENKNYKEAETLQVMIKSIKFKEVEFDKENPQKSMIELLEILTNND